MWPRQRIIEADIGDLKDKMNNKKQKAERILSKQFVEVAERQIVSSCFTTQDMSWTTLT